MCMLIALRPGGERGTLSGAGFDFLLRQHEWLFPYDLPAEDKRWLDLF